ncbi:hypothetical protein V6Z11_D10G050000 [Gossypium hirsutum]
MLLVIIMFSRKKTDFAFHSLFGEIMCIYTFIFTYTLKRCEEFGRSSNLSIILSNELGQGDWIITFLKSNTWMISCISLTSQTVQASSSGYRCLAVLVSRLNKLIRLCILSKMNILICQGWSKR